MIQKPIAPEFIAKLQAYIKEKGLSQKNLADKTKLSLTTINRIVKYGYGNIDQIASVLNAIELPQNVKFNLLVKHEAEICRGPAKDILQHGLHLYRSTDEYLADFCPVPLERAYAAAFYGISYKDIIALAKECGVVDLRAPGDTWYILKFAAAFEKKFGKEPYQAILGKQISRNFPHVLQMDFDKIGSASNYVKVINGDGKIIFDVPHVVLSYYNIRKSGSIESHSHKGGLEFACSLENRFRLIYEGKEYPRLMTPDGPILIYDAHKKHSIKLEEADDNGKLVIIRFYPDKKKLHGQTKKGEFIL